MGTVYSAYLFSYAIMMIPSGWFTDVAGPRVSLAGNGFRFGAVHRPHDPRWFARTRNVYRGGRCVSGDPAGHGSGCVAHVPGCRQNERELESTACKSARLGLDRIRRGLRRGLYAALVLLDARTLRLARFLLAGGSGQCGAGGTLVLVRARLPLRGETRADLPETRNNSVERAVHESRSDAPHRGLRHRKLLRIHLFFLALLLFRADSQNGHGSKRDLHDASCGSPGFYSHRLAAGHPTGSEHVSAYEMVDG